MTRCSILKGAVDAAAGGTDTTTEQTVAHDECHATWSHPRALPATTDVTNSEEPGACPNVWLAMLDHARYSTVASVPAWKMASQSCSVMRRPRAGSYLRFQPVVMNGAHAKNHKR